MNKLLKDHTQKTEELFDEGFNFDEEYGFYDNVEPDPNTVYPQDIKRFIKQRDKELIKSIADEIENTPSGVQTNPRNYADYLRSLTHKDNE